MKIVGIYLLLFSFVFQLGNRIYVILNFQVNREYIAENLCEKKEIEDNCCKGSCHLEKELVKIEKEDNNSPANKQEPIKEKSENDSFFISVLHKNPLLNGIALAYIPYKAKSDLSGYYSDIFHPPSS